MEQGVLVEKIHMRNEKQKDSSIHKEKIAIRIERDVGEAARSRHAVAVPEKR